MSASPAGGTVGAAGPGQASGGAAAAPPGRLARMRGAAAARGIPLPTIIATVAVVVLTYLAAGIPTVLFAAGHSLTAGIITAAAFIAYQQLENHVLNPVVMSRTVNVNPLLVLVSVLIGSSIGAWLGGLFGAFVAALLSIPCAAALQIIVRELWRATAPGGPLGGGEG
jgi:predicted PurR-regulated permease PerM